MSALTKLVSTFAAGCFILAIGAVYLRESPGTLAGQPSVASSFRPVTGQSTVSTTMIPSHGTVPGNTATLYADPRGHFMADIQIRGTPIKVLVDTGASVVAMSTEDAAKVGFRAGPGDRKVMFNTANGRVTASLIRLPEVRLQNITVFDVEAAIMPPGALQGTLLGMSFMQKLAGYESRGSSLVMRK